MDDTTKPRGLYQQPSGVWKIDKVVRGERIRLSTQTSNLVEAQTVLKRYVSNASRSQNSRPGKRWSKRCAAITSRG